MSGKGKGGRATRPPLQQHRINVGESPTLLAATQSHVPKSTLAILMDREDQTMHAKEKPNEWQRAPKSHWPQETRCANSRKNTGLKLT